MRPAVQQPISKDKILWSRQENTIWKTIIWPSCQRSRSQEGHYGTRHRLMVMHPYQISLTYPKRNHYLTLRSKVKVQHRSLWYATHHLMDMHPYQISLTYLKRNNYLTLRSKSNKGLYGMQHTTLWACTHIPNIIDLSRKKHLFDLEVKGQGPT